MSLKCVFAPRVSVPDAIYTVMFVSCSKSPSHTIKFYSKKVYALNGMPSDRRSPSYILMRGDRLFNPAVHVHHILTDAHLIQKVHTREAFFNRPTILSLV